jgi:hypothetical protein
MIALALAGLGLVGLVLGTVMPWFRESDIDTGGTPVSVPLLAASAAAALVTLTFHWRPRWIWLPLAAMVMLVVLASLTPDPGSICVDGVDGDGNPAGFCASDEWTRAPVVYGVGAALTMMGAGLRWLTAAPDRRPRPS